MLNSSNRYVGLINNILIFAINAFATKLITFLLVPLYTYFMSAGEYGITDMSLTVISLCMPLATLSIADACVRYIIDDRCRSSDYVFIGFSITLISVILIGFLSPLLDLSIFGGLGNYKSFFVIAYASSAFLQFCGEVVRGLGNIKIIPVCAGISSIVTCVSAVLLIGVFRAGIIGYFVSVSLGPLIGVFIYATIGKVGNIVIAGASSIIHCESVTSYFRDMFCPMLRYSLPLIPNSLFWWIGTSINRFFITGMLGISASGLFAAAGKIPNLLNTAYSVFQQAWQLSAFQESRNDGIDIFFSNVFIVLQATMTIFCALLSMFAPGLAGFFLQGEFYVSWTFIPILLLANIFNVFNAYFGTIYTSTMHTSYIMRTTLIGAISCVVLTPVLIPHFGIIGACIASAASNMIIFIMRAFDSRKYIRFRIYWIPFVTTLLLLIVQALVTCIQPFFWKLISLLCASLILLIQVLVLLKLLRKHRVNLIK